MDMWINGAWKSALSGKTMSVINPSTDAVIDNVPFSDSEDVDVAVSAADRAFKDWSKRDVSERSALLLNAISALEVAKDELLASLTAEQGKPNAEARGEFQHFINGLKYYAELATKDRGAYQDVPSAFGPAYSLIKRTPMGVVGAILPWNFPLTLLANKLAPALVTGNTIVVKPSDTTPLTTLRVAEIMHTAGIPDGVFNVITGDGPTTGEALVKHPRTPRIAFTGQSSTGRHIASLAAPLLKRYSLELGGSDPVIVFPDADLERAVKSIAIGRYWNAGQACLAPKRAIIFDEVYDEFVERLTKVVSRYEPGDGAVKADKPMIRIGPLHTSAQKARLVTQLSDSISQGAKVIIGGIPDDVNGDRLFPATLVENVPRESALAQQEIFGPVLPLFRVSSTEEALEIANDTPFGLGASVWSHDTREIHAVTRGVDSGIVWVNQLHYGYDEVPFGGVKASGLGKEHGIEALHEYTNVKSVVMGGF